MMKLASLTVGLHLNLNNIDYKIIRKSEGKVTLEKLADLELVRFDAEELLQALVKGTLKLVGTKKDKVNTSDNKDFFRSLSALPIQVKNDVLFRFQFVKAAMFKLRKKPTTVGLEKVIKQVVEDKSVEKSPSMDSVLRWWKRYYFSDNDITSLAKKKTGKAGRTSFSSIVINELHEVIEEDYLLPTRPPVMHVYDIFCHKMDAVNALRPEPLSYPSRSQFYRYVEKLEKYDVAVARLGKKEADQLFRESGKGPNASFILERVEVDHTPLDVFVVDDHTSDVIGRPNLTLILDSFSRMILGIYIGFEPPSLLSVMRALKQAVLPKNSESPFMSNVTGTWPAYGIPMTLICDNGSEFHANTFKAMCNDLHIDLQFCPKGKPQFKGKVERVLGRLNREVCQLIPGATFGSIAMRKDYDSTKHAVVKESQLTEYIYRWIIDIYSQTVHRTTKRTPYDLWMKGLENISPMLPESTTSLAFAMTDEHTRQLTFKGVEIFSMHYNSPTLTTMRHKKNSSFEVIVRADQEDISHIWVLDTEQEKFVKVPSTEPEYAEGLSYRKHKYIRELLRKEGLCGKRERAVLAHKAKLNEEIKKLKASKKVRKTQKGAQLSQQNQETLNTLTSAGANDQLQPDIEELDLLPFETAEIE